MSTDAVGNIVDASTVLFFGISIGKAWIYIFSGFFGGFFPLIYDLIQSHNLSPSQRVDRDRLYWIVKIFLIPTFAAIITALSVSSDGIANWFSALYLGATFPVLVGKLMAIKEKDVELPPGA